MTLNFRQFIEQFFPNYIIDNDNISVIDEINLWASRSPEFENYEKGYHLDKGILIMGSVGTGKTDLFRLLMKYLSLYLKNPYAFKYAVVWALTSDFNKRGYDAFDGHERGNIYYDELCLTNDRTKFPEKERAIHYGNKILIGEELILVRYNSFKQFGLQTHFSTNATIDELRDIYGQRAYSRLNEMCNFFIMEGEDRRLSGTPNIYKNINVTSINTPSTPISKEEIEDNKRILDNAYIEYCQKNIITDLAALYYNLLTIYGVNLGSDEELGLIKKEVERKFIIPFAFNVMSDSEQESFKKNSIATEYKKNAVKAFFDRMRQSNAKSIFGIVDFDAEKLINP